jgi:hypothetical protein
MIGCCYIVTSVYKLFFMHTLIIIIHVGSPSIVWHVIIVISIVIYCCILLLHRLCLHLMCLQLQSHL